jgi:hypothetical protein
MMTDLSFKDGLVQNLARSAATVVEYVLQHEPAEQQALLLPMLAARKATIIVSVCMEPPEVVGFVQAVDRAVGVDEHFLARHFVRRLAERPEEVLGHAGVAIHRAAGAAAPLLLGQEGVEGPLPGGQGFVEGNQGGGHGRFLLFSKSATMFALRGRKSSHDGAIVQRLTPNLQPCLRVV